ncbi:MAG TPA: 16S rRNA methyltransferase [Thermoplasmatales archaeon]|nr:16S rRNA methyltransferase [Thermoplasmatales archaeon]
MIIIVLAEAELELVPSKIWSHPVVVASAKRREKESKDILLDSNYHHTAIRYLEDSNRRGRPDIVHTFLLVVLESIANKKGLVKTIVHTRNDDVIYIDRETRIMRSYNRFVGLMEQLFKTGVVPNEDNPLLKMERGLSLEKLIEKENPDRVIAFSAEGKRVNILDYLKNLHDPCKRSILFLIGGFPKGDFRSDVGGVSDEIISIYDEPLTAWTVASELLSTYNLICGNSR